MKYLSGLLLGLFSVSLLSCGSQNRSHEISVETSRFSKSDIVEMVAASADPICEEDLITEEGQELSPNNDYCSPANLEILIDDLLVITHSLTEQITEDGQILISGSLKNNQAQALANYDIYQFSIGFYINPETEALEGIQISAKGRVKSVFKDNKRIRLSENERFNISLEFRISYKK